MKSDGNITKLPIEMDSPKYFISIEKTVESAITYSEGLSMNDGKLVIQGSHMVSGTRCPAWSD